MRSLHADAFRKLPYLAVAQHELLLQIGAFELLSCFTQGKSQEILFDQRLVFGRGARYLRFYLFERDILVRFRHQQAADQVLQFAHVVRPRVIPQPVLRRDTETTKSQSFRVDELIHVIVEQLRNVFRILAERGHAQSENTQVRDQVTTQVSRAQLVLVVCPHRRHDSCIEGYRSPATLAGEAAVLEDAEQCSLRIQIEVCQFVDNQGALTRFLECTHVNLAVLLAAEQILLGQRGGGDADQWAICSTAQGMQVTGKCGPAGAGFATNEHRPVVPGILFDLVAQRLHQGTAANGREQRRQCAPARRSLPAGRLQRTLHRSQEFRE